MDVPKFLRFHKRTSDLSLAPFFNVYLNRLRGLYQGGVRYLTKSDVRPYWRADLRISGEDLFVNLSPRDTAAFEFFTTGKPIYTGSVTQEGLSMTSIKAACVSVTAQLDNGVVTWGSRINAGKRAIDGRTLSPLARPFQVQLVDEPIDYAPPTTILGRSKYRKVLFESWAPGTSHSGVHLTNFTQGRQTTNLAGDFGTAVNNKGTVVGLRGSAGTNLLRDVQYDWPWAMSEDGKPITFALLNSETPGLTPAATTPVDWPRASGVQTVTSATYGKREFAIYIDSFNQVSAFPTGLSAAAAGVNQTIDQTYVKTSGMTLPGWVYVPTTRLKDHWALTGSTGLVDFPEYDWCVHPDGTKAVAIVYAKQDIAIDSISVLGASGHALAVGYENLYTGAAKRALGNNTGTQRHVAPGLIEISITIAITGPNAQDFTLTVTPTTLRDPTTTDYCTLFAGYLTHTITGSGSRGDLCVWDVERYYRMPDDAEMPHAWNGPGSTASYDARVRTVSGEDHERFGITGYTAVPNVALITGGVTAADLLPYGNDQRRTLYSLKNVTAGKELRTFPGAPSGVAQGYYIPPIIFGPNAQDQFAYGVIVAPMHSRSQFLKVDMRTLSFVMKFQVGTFDVRYLLLAPGGGDPNIVTEHETHHPAVAIWTFNTLRDTFYPSTMPNAYVAPSGYSEPTQDGVKTRLKALINSDFRASHMATHTWTLLPLGGGPADWTSQDMGILRLWAWKNEGNTTLRTLVPSGYTIVDDVDPTLAMWWSALSTFGRSTGLTLTAAPKFHWAAYSDLIVNAVMSSPLTTFFVHPNGTYAYFDQTHFYNTNGVPIRTGVTGTDSNYDLAQYWDAAKVEHWIIDKVHLSFNMAGQIYAKETGFRELYNDAVERLQPAPVTEPLQRIELSDLTATVSKLASGSISPYGLSLQVTWGGHTYDFSEDTVPNGSGVDGGDGNSGTIDWSLDYIHDGQVPQLADTHITFSSCVLTEMLHGQ